jgi:RNA polymerase sigma-70 factor (ECF subfamily)
MFLDPGSREVAFTQIVERYQRKLYWHVRRIVISHEDADDVLQNTFLKVWNNLEHFRGGSGLYTWLYRVATNEALSFLKKKKKNNLLPWSGYEKQLEETLESDEYFSGDVIAKKLQKALVRLPEKQRLVFNMKYFENMKYEEISEILGTTVGALKASYHHAVKKIEQFIERD